MPADVGDDGSVTALVEKAREEPLEVAWWIHHGLEIGCATLIPCCPVAPEEAGMANLTLSPDYS